MPIKKYGTEPARTETRVEDNDPATLEALKKQGQDSKSERTEPRRTNDDGESS